MVRKLSYRLPATKIEKEMIGLACRTNGCKKTKISCVKHLEKWSFERPRNIWENISNVSHMKGETTTGIISVTFCFHYQ
jgi:hypothetical protein